MAPEPDLPGESEFERIYYQHVALPSAKVPLVREKRRTQTGLRGVRDRFGVT